MIKRAIFFIHDELRQLRLLMWVLLVLTFSLWQHCLANLEIKQINPYAKILKILHKEPLRGEAMYNVSIHHRDYVQEMWLPQNVDHFADIADDLSNQTWMMRYYVNSEFYQAGGPIFIMVGGEWEITPSFLHRGHFYDMAQEHSGIMFYTEHRYYGKSWPRSSASTEDLEYLNVLQSLEDLRYFIEYQKSSWSDLHDAKVVLVGCSYSGSMVAWFMKLYPKMAEVAWASSAPLVAKMDFMGESENIKRIRRSTGNNGYTLGDR
ncbi:putative serine protease K12H4.7 [Haematobia irritans]|uniref:putative serine protease K12H4.7 n=1 Tax=Haematobia irritans TaxID=7368 RepID=UPI003F4F700A